MTHDIRWQQRLANYDRALLQLTAAVELSRERALSSLEKQGVIQGFEIVHELGWNVLKDFLEYEGIRDVIGSRSAIREAFKRGLIADGECWMDMIAKRNLSSHTYNQALADELAKTIVGEYYRAFVNLQQDMHGRSKT